MLCIISKRVVVVYLTPPTIEFRFQISNAFLEEALDRPHEQTDMTGHSRWLALVLTTDTYILPLVPQPQLRLVLRRHLLSCSAPNQPDL